jgi:hypothetical protein
MKSVPRENVRLFGSAVFNNSINTTGRTVTVSSIFALKLTSPLIYSEILLGLASWRCVCSANRLL